MVLVITRDGIGSGVVIGANEIVTNWHVVSGFSEVAVAFKPKVEGGAIAEADVARAKVSKVNEVSDLALLTLPAARSGASTIAFGQASEVKVGADVHAIGHPTGEAWTYTKGIVSQVRRGYAWTSESGVRHTADVIQTQTPINPGNSGGPLLNDDGALIGINSFKAPGEALNFAVSVAEVLRLIAAQCA